MNNMIICDKSSNFFVCFIFEIIIKTILECIKKQPFIQNVIVPVIEDCEYIITFFIIYLGILLFLYIVNFVSYISYKISECFKHVHLKFLGFITIITIGYTFMKIIQYMLYPKIIMNSTG